MEVYPSRCLGALMATVAALPAVSLDGVTIAVTMLVTVVGWVNWVASGVVVSMGEAMLVAHTAAVLEASVAVEVMMGAAAGEEAMVATAEKVE